MMQTKKQPTQKKVRLAHKKVAKPSALSFDEFKLRKEAQEKIADSKRNKDYLDLQGS